MRVVKMEYNPYKMKTSICIDGSDVKGNSNYRSIDDFIGRGTPLQTWVEPIDYLNWPGLLNEIADPENNGEIEFCFSGRKIDFEDLKRSLEDQNKNREEGTRLSLRFRQEDPQLDDKKLSGNIEDIVKELQSDRFRELIEERSRSQTLQKKYEALETNYAKAKEREFDVVFAGVYSSGKSTLLNTLIRHNILPTSDSTCTSKNCRIKHDGSLGNKVSLLGLDEDQKVVLPKSVFDSDEACASKFMEVCPTGKVNPQYEKVTTIEIGADLSHLYPKSVSEKNFTLVLVDTPGMDSAQSIDEHGVNQHARLAQLAITHDNSKPMVVLCADAQKYEDKSIGEFMGDIIQQSVDERGGFNDRFLFLMNKCDSLTYGNGERIEDRKAAFAQYLRDSGKWGIASEEDEKRIQEAAHFVPRIFPVTAIVASAIQRGADKYSGEELTKEPVKRTLCNRLEEFQKNVCRYTDSNYYLSQFCDIPAYRRVEMDTAFRKALKAGDIITATQLQCGLMSVECAIRDYIARYAYPIKVRDLLETFEDILTDVCSFKDSTVADIQRRIDKLGENDGARKEAEERKRLAAERSAKLEEAKKLIDAQLDKLDEIEFDATALGKAREQFEASIDADPITVLEEAHNLLKRTSTEQSAETANLLGKSVEMLANSIAEMRTYGEAFVIADQSPGLLDMSVIRNTNTKIIMRLPDFSDRELVGKSAGLNDDQIGELARLPRGVAAVYQSDWVNAVLCAVDKPDLKETPYRSPGTYPAVPGDSLLFNLLDSGFREKVDMNRDEEDLFRSTIIRSTAPTEVKVKLLDYLDNRETTAGIHMLSSLVFDHFKNAKEALEGTIESPSVDTLKMEILAKLEPSIMQYSDDQINALLTLIISEYTNRYLIDYPVWREFAQRVSEGGIV